MLKINRERFEELFTLLDKQGRLYLPVAKDGKTDYAAWSAGSAVDLAATVTAKSPKGLFFPQIENLMEFTRTGNKLALEARPLPVEKTIAFGVRACDLASFKLLDKVFLKEPVDEYYAARRSNCTLIGLACSEPEETCFCHAFGIDLAEGEADVRTYQVGDELFWEAATPKGEELTAAVSGLLTEEASGAAKVAKAKTAVREVFQKMPLAGLKLSAEKCKAPNEIFADKAWEELSKTCIGCGTCTYVCPTCHCYDVRDHDGGERVERYRCWDSCLFSDFTNMSGGNPRTGRLERFRQRYMHKLIYFPDNNEGDFACVGCGRCLQKCPVSLNIVKVARALGVTENV